MAKKKAAGARKTIAREISVSGPILEPCERIPSEVLEWLRGHGHQLLQGQSIVTVTISQGTKTKSSRTRRTARRSTPKR